MLFRDVVQLDTEALPTLNNVNDRRASFNCFTLLSTPPSVAVNLNCSLSDRTEIFASVKFVYLQLRF